MLKNATEIEVAFVNDRYHRYEIEMPPHVNAVESHANLLYP